MDTNVEYNFTSLASGLCTQFLNDGDDPKPRPIPQGRISHLPL